MANGSQSIYQINTIRWHTMTVLQCFTPLLHSVFAVQAPGKPSGLKSRGRADLMECNSSLPRAHCENTK